MANTKSKKVLGLLLACLMFASLSVFFCFDTAFAAEEQHSGSWAYYEVSGGAQISAYTGSDTAVTVPAKLDNGLKVVSVLGMNKNKKEKIKSIVFSSGIQTIEAGALNGFTALESVTFKGAALKTLGAGAFEGCKNLKSVTLPSSVKSLGAGAFTGCSSLTSISMKCTATEIPDRMFYGCSSLNNVTLPYYVSKIGANAFGNCKKLKNVTLPTTLTSIGDSAFEGCTSLTSPVFPTEKLISIGKGAYRGCTTIANVFIPNCVKNIYSGAFSGCSSLLNVYVSPSVKVLEKEAFSACPKLQNIVFGGQNNSYASIFDTSGKPTLYYPTKYQSSWNSFSYSNKKVYGSYAATPDIKTANLEVNKSKTVKVTVAPKASPIGDAYIFVTGNPAIATVSNKGVIQAKGPGITTVSVVSILGTKSDITVTVTPKAPSVTASPKSTTSIDVKWNAVTGATSYEVYRATSSNGTYSLLTTTLSTSYTDKGLANGATYFYKVKAFTKSGSKKLTSGFSNVSSCAATSPTPTGVSATKAALGKATIKWSKALGATGYEVFMSTSKTGTYTSIGTTGASTLSLTKSGLSGGKTYYFKVCSYTMAGGKKVYSPYSAVKSVKV